jgi:hypothetical protein
MAKIVRGNACRKHNTEDPRLKVTWSEEQGREEFLSPVDGRDEPD